MLPKEDTMQMQALLDGERLSSKLQSSLIDTVNTLGLTVKPNNRFIILGETHCVFQQHKGTSRTLHPKTHHYTSQCSNSWRKACRGALANVVCQKLLSVSLPTTFMPWTKRTTEQTAIQRTKLITIYVHYASNADHTGDMGLPWSLNLLPMAGVTSGT